MDFLTEKQLKNMMDLQDQMNRKVNLNWRNEDYPWEDAILTEAAEAYDHTNWPWWKSVGKEIDRDQIKMEIVDIWHFILSDLMTHEVSEDYTHFSIVDEITKIVDHQRPEGFKPDINSIRASIKNVMAVALSPKDEGRIALLVHSFVCLTDVMEMGWQEVYKMYIAKNCLNQFRQEHGYKANAEIYKKTWAVEKGWEDNQYLTEIIEGLDVNSDSYIEDIKSALEDKYQLMLDDAGPE